MGKVRKDFRTDSCVDPHVCGTFGETATSWLKEKEYEGGVDDVTLAYYETHLYRHIFPEVGDVKLDQVGVRRVLALRDTLRGKKLGPKCVSKIQATLSAVLDYGVEHGLIATNPAASLRRRRRRSGGGKRSGGSKKALRGVGPEEILNAEEIAELLNVTPLGDPAYQVAIMVAALTGMRINEVLGLRWLNVDFGQAIIRVRESLTWVRRRGDTQSTWRLKVPQNWGT